MRMARRRLRTQLTRIHTCRFGQVFSTGDLVKILFNIIVVMLNNEDFIRFSHLYEDLYCRSYGAHTASFFQIKRRASMRQCMDAENLHRRLKKILGQVQAIDRMIDEDVPCEDVLAQINAAKSALHGCGRVVLEGHIKHCVRDGIEHGDADKTIDSFTKAVERFANMT
jgi:hypothetical protein